MLKFEQFKDHNNLKNRVYNTILWNTLKRRTTTLEHYWGN